MIALVRVELTRLRWRRAVLLLVAVAIIVPLLILAARAWDTRPASDADIADAEREVAEQLAFIEQDVANCLADPADFGFRGPNGAARCERFIGGYEPTVNDFLYRDQLRLGEERESTGTAVVAIIVVAMILAGTTYAGHDWNSGSMSNQLLFESRRWRVWSAKALAVALMALVVAAVALTLFWGGLWLLAETRGLDPTDKAVREGLQQGGRGALLAAAGALGGYALTMLCRSTVFTIGVLFGVAVAGALLFGALLPGRALHYEPTTNALAIVTESYQYYVEVPDRCFTDRGVSDDPECDTTAVVTVEDATLYYAVLLLALGGVSAASYRRRDVP